jgi:hypothetical protein
MNKIALGFALLLVASASAFGQCKNTLRVQSASAIGLSLCSDVPALESGKSIVIEAGGSQIVTTVKKSSGVLTEGVFKGTQNVDAEVAEPAKAQENVLLLSGVDTATIKLDAKVFIVTVQRDQGAQNLFNYQWSVGPATKGDKNGATASSSADSGANDTNSSPGAVRLHYTGEYARGGFFGGMKKLSLQTTASLSIDTSDQSSPDFVDNNQATLGVQLKNLSFGRLWMHGGVGIEARIEKAFHQDVRNIDASLTASGWVPILRSFTLFSKNGEFIAAPLSFKASYGYRDHNQSGASVNGRVFEGSALYHLFLLDQFQISFSATLTHNDLNNQPSGIPRTQRLYKATIAYLENTESGFKVLTSVEDGSAGVMLRKVRQYFIGVAISKLNLSGSGGN